MSSISSITKAVSGLTTAQKGLMVTGQNLSNVNTKGFTRQQLLQAESSYLTIGNRGGRYMQVGLGVSQTEIRQIRDELADRRLREETSVLNYYQTQNATIEEVLGILDEPYGEGVTNLLNKFWSQTSKLSSNPDGVEERQSFISAANVLIKKINDITESITKMQTNANSEVIKAVGRVNEIIKGISEYNELINQKEINGDNANDYRDQRNVLLDELSTYGKISYYEEADSRVVLKFENHIVVDGPFVTSMKLRSIDQSVFVNPAWTDTDSDVYHFNETITAAKENDTGKLKALLVTRGENYVTGTTTWNDIALNDNFSVDQTGNSFILPKIQKLLNDFTSQLVDLVNDNLKGTGIGIHEGQPGVPVFVPIKASQPFLAGNIQVNPLLLEDGGYNKLGTVDAGGDDNNVGDNSCVDKLLREWSMTRGWYEGVTDASTPHAKRASIMSFYAEFVTDIGTDGTSYSNMARSKSTSVMNIENERQAIGGVSMDEEFTYMLKYQYAYNASARMITMLDSMLDTIINKM